MCEVSVILPKLHPFIKAKKIELHCICTQVLLHQLKLNLLLTNYVKYSISDNYEDFKIFLSVKI